jgi:glyoxylase-like metal-dependent hydrolase (beta-lactamase superfamily II)
MQVFERGWLSANNVLFTGTGPATLVDSGYVTHAAQTLALVEHALDGRPLERIITTHLHSDHCGGNAALQQRYGCPVAIPVADAPAVRPWNVEKLNFHGTGQQCPRFEAQETLSPGDSLMLAGQEWQVLGAPGHDAHSLILFCPADGILISADALWRNGFGVIFPELDGESGFAEERATLEMIDSLDVRLVIPGHGPMFTDVKEALKRAFNRLTFLEASPVRNAENAVKVMLKFLLLERQQMPLAEVPALFAGIPLMQISRTRYLDKTNEELAEWAVQGLVRAGAARRDGELLRNHDF